MELTWSIPFYVGPVLVVFAVAAGLMIRRLYRDTEPRAATLMRRLLTGLRVAVVGLLIWALAGPALLRTLGRTVQPSVVVVVEDSASMDLRDAPDGASRWERAAWLTATVDSLLAHHASGIAVTHLRGNGLAGSVAWQPEDEPASPVARGTDLRGLVSDLAKSWADRSLRAVVVLTDGHETATVVQGDGLTPAAGVKTLIVGVGDPDGPPDLLLQDLHYPDTAFQGDELVVEATVGLRMMAGAANRSVTLHLVQNGDTLATATAEAAADDQSVRIDLVFEASRPGLNLFDLIVDAADNERYLANNQSSLAIAVRDERSRLLLLSGHPGWTVRALAHAALREPRLTLDVAYPGPDGFMLADSAGTWTLPRTTGEWADWDGVVLVGTAGLADRVSWPALAEAVRGGLGLLVMPPLSADGADRVLAALLPVSGLEHEVEGQWAPVITDGVLTHPLLSRLGTGGDSPFADLPPLTILTRCEPGPTATELLSARSLHGSTTTRSLLLTGNAGAGTVTYFASPDLWSLVNWQPPNGFTGEREHAAVRLARNMLAWTALGRSLAGVTIAGHRNLYREGETITLETQGRDMRGDEHGRPVSLKLTRIENETDVVAGTYHLENVAGRPGRSRATLPPLPPARYAVQPVYAGTDSAAGPARPFVIISSTLEEMQTWQDSRHLRGLARNWRGVYVDGGSPGSIAALCAALAAVDWTAATIETETRSSLWAGWPLFLTVALLLGVEWFLRRSEGML